MIGFYIDVMHISCFAWCLCQCAFILLGCGICYYRLGVWGRKEKGSDCSHISVTIQTMAT